MDGPSDFNVRHYLPTSDDSGYYSSSTTTATSMPSLVSVPTSSTGAQVAPEIPSAPSTRTSNIATKPPVTVEALIARRIITWAPLPEKLCGPISNTIKDQQRPSKTQHQSQPKAVSRGRSKTIRTTSSSRTKARTPARSTSKKHHIPTTIQLQGHDIAEPRGRSRTTRTTSEVRIKVPSRAERNAWKRSVQTKTQHQRESTLTALIRGSKANQAAPRASRNAVFRVPAILAQPSARTNTTTSPKSNTKTKTEHDNTTVTTTAKSSPITIPLDPWGQPNDHLAATTTWTDERQTIYLADGTKAAMTVNSFGERMPVEIARWGEYWGNYRIGGEGEVEDWGRDFRLW